jgi:hypothetical protein
MDSTPEACNGAARCFRIGMGDRPGRPSASVTIVPTTHASVIGARRGHGRDAGPARNLITERLQNLHFTAEIARCRFRRRRSKHLHPRACCLRFVTNSEQSSS